MKVKPVSHSQQSSLNAQGFGLRSLGLIVVLHVIHDHHSHTGIGVFSQEVQIIIILRPSVTCFQETAHPHCSAYNPSLFSAFSLIGF